MVDADAWVPLLTTQVCLLFTLSLVRQAGRTRRPYLLSWAVALACFTVAAGALWYGTAFGWAPTSFRLYYVGGALLGVPWLALGQVQLLTGRSTGRLLAVLVFLASAAAAAVVGLDELRGPVVPHGLPVGRDLLPTLPRALVGVGNAVGVAILVGGLAVSVRRQWRAGAAGRSRSAGLALIAAGALVAGLGGTLTVLGRASANAVGVLVGLSLVYAGAGQAGRSVGRHRGLVP